MVWRRLQQSSFLLYYVSLLIQAITYSYQWIMYRRSCSIWMGSKIRRTNLATDTDCCQSLVGKTAGLLCFPFVTSFPQYIFNQQKFSLKKQLWGVAGKDEFMGKALSNVYLVSAADLLLTSLLCSCSVKTQVPTHRFCHQNCSSSPNPTEINQIRAQLFKLNGI